MSASVSPMPAPAAGGREENRIQLGTIAACGRLPGYVRLVYRLARDPRVPWFLKALVFGAAAYALLPWDALPDLVPIREDGDEIVVALLTVRELVTLAPAQVVAEHWAEVFGPRSPSLEELSRRIEHYQPQVRRQLLLAYQNIIGLVASESPETAV